MRPIDELQVAQTTYARLVGMAHAYDYFFRQGNSFDRSREDELSRNFLMHSMMYKNVSKTICMKLMLLLAEVIELKQLCTLGEGSVLSNVYRAE